MIYNGENQDMLNEIFNIDYKKASSIQNIEYLLNVWGLCCQ